MWHASGKVITQWNHERTPDRSSWVASVKCLASALHIVHFMLHECRLFKACLFSVAVLGPCCGELGLLSSCGARALRCVCFPRYRAHSLGSMGFSGWGMWLGSWDWVLVGHRLSCSLGWWHLPGWGIEPIPVPRPGSWILHHWAAREAWISPLFSWPNAESSEPENAP